MATSEPLVVSRSLPTIYLDLLRAGNDTESKRLLSACRSYGFFYLDLSSDPQLCKQWEGMLVRMNHYFEAVLLAVNMWLGFLEAYCRFARLGPSLRILSIEKNASFGHCYRGGVASQVLPASAASASFLLVLLHPWHDDRVTQKLPSISCLLAS